MGQCVGRSAFLKHQSSFIWSSERSGTNHLYLYDMQGHLRHALTQGAWNVDGLLSVDESAGLAYFASNRDAVIDQQIYTPCGSMDGTGRNHAASAAATAGTARNSPAIRGATRCMWIRSPIPIPHRRSASMRPTGIASPGWKPTPWIQPILTGITAAVMSRPEFGQIRAEDGQELHYSVMKPPHFDPSRRYPVFLNVYGGPGVQVVSRTWPRPFDEYMAQQGYVVFALDNRGSARRSRAFTDRPPRTPG